MCKSVEKHGNKSWLCVSILNLLLTRPVNIEESQLVKKCNLSRLIANSVSSLPQSMELATRMSYYATDGTTWQQPCRSRTFARHYATTIAHPRSKIPSAGVQPTAETKPAERSYRLSPPTPAQPSKQQERTTAQSSHGDHNTSEQ